MIAMLVVLKKDHFTLMLHLRQEPGNDLPRCARVIGDVLVRGADCGLASSKVNDSLFSYPQTTDQQYKIIRRR